MLQNKQMAYKNLLLKGCLNKDHANLKIARKEFYKTLINNCF